MIKLPNWLAGLRPTSRNKRVPFLPDKYDFASFLPKPPPDVAAAIDRDLDRRIADGLMLRRGSNPPAPAPGSIPATTDSGKILVTPPKPQPNGGRLIRGDVDPGPVPSPLLLEIRNAIDNEPFGDEPRAVLLAVARWLRAQGAYTAVALLEREAGE